MDRIPKKESICVGKITNICAKWVNLEPVLWPGNTSSDCFKPGLEFIRIEKNTYLFKLIKAINEIERERNQSVPKYKIAQAVEG